MSESQLHLRPGILAGSYPQKSSSELDELEQQLANFFKRWQQRLRRKKRSLKYVSLRVKQLQEELQSISEDELTTAIDELRDQLYHQGLGEESLILQAFATIREASARSLGKSHFDVQLYGGWLMINGMLAEMETGEGKTLTMTLPACTAALAGIPVHVVGGASEAAELEGATLWQTHRHVTLPLVKPIILFMVITGLIGAFE